MYEVRESNVEDVVRGLWRARRLLLAVTLLGALLGAGTAVLVGGSQTYTSSATIQQVNDPITSLGSDVVNLGNLLAARATVIADRITSSAVESTGADMSVSVSADDAIGRVTVSVTAPTAEEAMAAATALVTDDVAAQQERVRAALDQSIEAYSADLEQIEAQLAAAASESERVALLQEAGRYRQNIASLDIIREVTSGGITVASQGSEAVASSTPVLIWAVGGGVLLLLLASVVVGTRAVLDHRVRTRADVLAHVRAPWFVTLVDEPTASGIDVAARVLRERLPDGGTVLVTGLERSATPDVADALAASLELAGSAVTVRADRDRPAGDEAAPGGGADVPPRSFVLLAAGSVLEDRGLTLVPDSFAAVVLVARWGATTWEALASAALMVDGIPVGVVVDAVPSGELHRASAQGS